MLYNSGDFILCRVSNDRTIIFDVDFDDSRYQGFKAEYFEILSCLQLVYIILGPDSLDPHYGILVDEDVIREFKIEPKYYGKKVIAIKELSVGGRKAKDYYRDALKCKFCLEPFPYAVPNYPNDVLVCYVCRTDTRNKFKLDAL